MELETKGKIVGYHYSNPEAYRSLQTKGINGYMYFDFENFTGLIPHRRFIKISGRSRGLPDEANGGVIEGLLEPEPKSWLENPEFPNLWGHLMHDICREKNIILLSFQLNRDDKAYVVERAHAERELYGPSKKDMSQGFKKYWESRVPVFEYDGSYSLPQLAIWSGIEFDRLKVEWVNPTDEVWQRVLDNNW